MRRTKSALALCLRSRFVGLQSLVVLIALAAVGASANAAVPYSSYTYNYWEEKVPSPHAYVPTAVIDGQTLGVGDLRTPLDVVVGANDAIYLLDSGNNRILCLDASFSVTRVISEFDNDGQVDRFRSPSGLFLTDEQHIYVADTGNARIVELDETGNLVRTIGPPTSDTDETLSEGFVYRPKKVGVDPAGRMYVISEGVFDGLMSLDVAGNFQGFIGAPRVAPSAADLFWSRVATRRQRERKALFLPITYSSLDIDDLGFIYATVDTAIDRTAGEEAKKDASRTEEVIKRLSPSGVDVLRREGFTTPKGNIVDPNSEAVSIFRDITYRSFRGYSALDGNNRQVYTYDDNGNLLYVFGGKGLQVGNLLEPVALDVMSDERILILDKGRNILTVYSPTPYATAIHLALRFYQAGMYDQSTEIWMNVLALNSNYDPAYRGIARARLQAEDYEGAMRYAVLGYDRSTYSKAFRNLRELAIEQHFGEAAFLLAAIIVAALIGRKALEAWRKRSGDAVGASYSLTVLPGAGMPTVDGYVSGEPVSERHTCGGRGSTGHTSELQTADRGPSDLRASGVHVSHGHLSGEHISDGHVSTARRLLDSLRFSLFVILHPLDGFWELKHEKKGSVPAATIILILVCISFVVFRQYVGFLFNYRNLSDLNIYREMASILLPFGLWCIVSWAMTTLMDGKGTVKDIYIASSYGLTPLVLLLIPTTLLSRVLVLEEAQLYVFLVVLATGWSLLLIFLGSMVIHDYDVVKNAITSACSLAGIGMVIFIALLFSSILAKSLAFVMDVYYEIVLRL
jgi:hypothetical protein